MLKNLHLWLPGYLVPHRRDDFVSPTHLFFCLVDHFEPEWGNSSPETARARVQHWVDHYPLLADQFHDADGRPPQHTFFFPAEQYRPEFLEPLAGLSRRGYGEVEIHLHHRHDTAPNLARTLEQFKTALRGHGLLSADPSGRVRYAFIHGNWALDNSRPDGDWCGVNNELQVLRDTGCYADFTLPSAPSACQTRKINSIYYATDDPQHPKSHNTGPNVRAHGQPPITCPGAKPLAAPSSLPVANGNQCAPTPTKPEPLAAPASALPDAGDLMIVQGPLALNWRERSRGVFPRIENAEVSGPAPATPARLDLWVRQHIGVQGRHDWVFVKIHTHGCQERNFDAVTGAAAARLHADLSRRFNDGQRFVLHYVTARELFNLVKAAEAGHPGPPSQLRDFLLPPPPVRR